MTDTTVSGGLQTIRADSDGQAAVVDGDDWLRQFDS